MSGAVPPLLLVSVMVLLWSHLQALINKPATVSISEQNRIGSSIELRTAKRLLALKETDLVSDIESPTASSLNYTL